jgi:mono/diheme cytochrome c family protein
LLILGTGMFNVSAAGNPGAAEKAMAGWVVGASVYWRAPDESIPTKVDDGVLASGLEHYRSMCLPCHGAPDVEPAEFAGGLYPPAPDLTEQEWSDGELFWTIENGIRMTGMPSFGATHRDEQIWHIVAFVQHLPDLKPAEEEALREGQAGGHGHGESGGHEEAGQPQAEPQPGAADDSDGPHTHGSHFTPSTSRVTRWPTATWAGSG